MRKFGGEIEKEVLEMYFGSMEFGRDVVLSFREWVYGEGGFEKDGVIYLPGDGGED
ncbi:hypothetical protein AMET1_0418 [Methanonatronarchaeum thermophilum]|uniref:Uncharacterized protein n=1 Tax=Methanonatronarchaeum thermophilum TaxID=1927129 RepID=A0A1Y3GBY4_9EURY|nr:hypothetical protein [Methanonatronarchaeum thermophilum]OUJ18767.1 hypothetical protein AMET1_0418 [Methanonatronarchaeum thermophilum]